MNRKNLLLLLAAAVSTFAYYGQSSHDARISPDVSQAETRSAVLPRTSESEQASEKSADQIVERDSDVEQAISRHARNAEVEGTGTVVKVLRDDLDGSRHQKFLVRMPSGHVILIAHNIDLAPRVDDLHEGDPVSFYGEYVWNEKGGVVHWTHRDPGGRHQAGWLRHSQHTYQ